MNSNYLVRQTRTLFGTPKHEDFEGNLQHILTMVGYSLMLGNLKDPSINTNPTTIEDLLDNVRKSYTLHQDSPHEVYTINLIDTY